MTTSPRLALPYLEAAQAQKHVTVNEALRILDAVVQLSAVSATTAAPPGSPTNGAAYIVPAGATGAWSGWAGSVAFYADTAWLRVLPKEGMLAWVQDTDVMMVYGGSAWATLKADAERFWGRLTSDRTLTSTTAAQKLFDFGGGGGGALTLEVGHYALRGLVKLTGMSATDGNGAFSLAGTATLAEALHQTMGRDSNTISTAATISGAGVEGAAFPGNIVSPSTGTEMMFNVVGTFRVSGAGTIIPSFALTTAAAATVKAGSYIEVQRLGPAGVNYVGAWA
jgi:hypothetical protein